jgi:ribonuclease HI
MKPLKFSPLSVPKIESGEITKTWRLFDDKQLEVGDTLQCVNSETGQTFGYANITQVSSKRIKDLDEFDKSGHETYETEAQILDQFRKYYGESVTEETVIKVISYSFSKQKQNADVVTNTKIITEIKLFTDGGSRGNPGPSATGVVITDLEGNVVTNTGKYLGITTNNQAEYQAVLQGLELAKEQGARIVHVYMDSLLVVNQMIGIFKIKNRELWPIHQAIKNLVSQFEKVNFTHIPREMNRLADAEVNKALDDAEKKSGGIPSELL